MNGARSRALETPFLRLFVDMLESPCGSEHENPDARTIYIIDQGQWERDGRVDVMEITSECGKHTLHAIWPPQNEPVRRTPRPAAKKENGMLKAKTNNVLKIVFLLALHPMGLFANSSKKLELPLEEIKRPLSLPPRNWRIGIDAGPLFSFDKIERNRPFFSGLDYWRLGMDGGPLFRHEKIVAEGMELNPIFAYPYFQLGKRWEYYLPAVFKFYIVKNVQTTDSILTINGPNLASTMGLIFAGYNAVDGVVLEVKSILDYKQPISDKVWLISNWIISFQTSVNTLDASLGAGMGLQISKRFYATFVPSISYSNYQIEYWKSSFLNSGYSPHKIRKNYVNGNIPFLLGMNLTSKISVYWKTNGRLNSEDDAQLRTGIGIYLTL